MNQPCCKLREGGYLRPSMRQRPQQGKCGQRRSRCREWLLKLGDQILRIELEQSIRLTGEMFPLLCFDLVNEGFEDVLGRPVIASFELLAGIVELLVEAVEDAFVGDPAQIEGLVFVGDEGVEKS